MEFCPICYKQTEKEIWKKETRFTEIRWVFCPNHGYIKDNNQRTALNLRIQSVKIRRKNAEAIRRTANIKQSHIFLLSRGLITSVLCFILSLCMVLGYLVGRSSKKHENLSHLIFIGSLKKSPSAEHLNYDLLERNILQSSLEGVDSSLTLPGEE